MLILIPTGRQYRSELQVQLERNCRCEHCHQFFRYRYKLSGVGTGDSPLWMRNEAAGDAAETMARQALEKQLTTAFPPFPCPHCGRFQSLMIAYHRSRFAAGPFHFSLFLIAAFALVSALFIVIDGPRNTIATATFWKINGGPLALFLILFLLRRFVKPSQSPVAYGTDKDPVTRPDEESIAIVPRPPDPPTLGNEPTDFDASRRYGRFALVTTLLFPVAIVLAILSIREYRMAVRAFRDFPDYSPIPDRSGLTYAFISLSIIAFFLTLTIAASLF